MGKVSEHSKCEPEESVWHLEKVWPANSQQALRADSHIDHHGMSQKIFSLGF